jgi:hypothetical protein
LHAYLLARVLTRILFCPLECWYCVINWTYPLPPWGMGALCWFTTSKNTANVVLGYRPHVFHKFVPLTPISVSDTYWFFWFIEIQEPIQPDTFNSRDVWKDEISASEVFWLAYFLLYYRKTCALQSYNMISTMAGSVGRSRRPEILVKRGTWVLHIQNFSQFQRFFANKEYR